MRLLLECFILGVGHGDYERTFVCFIGYGCLGITRQVETIKLIEKGDKFVPLKSIIDRHYTDACLLQELDVSARHISGLSVLDASINLIVDASFALLVEISAQRFGEHTNDWSLRVIDKLCVAEFLLHRDHVTLDWSLLPGLPEVICAGQERMLDGVDHPAIARHHTYCGKQAETGLHDYDLKRQNRDYKRDSK